MRPVSFAFLLLGTCAAYFTVRATTSLGDVPPLPVVAVFIGLMGATILVATIGVRVSRRLNRPSRPPFFTNSKSPGGRCLELDADGSFKSCEVLLSELANKFDATSSKHLEAGPRPDSDKDKGYWHVMMFGQPYFLMRDRGHGICIWGPNHPEDPEGFLRIADHFGAVEFRTWQQKLVSWLPDTFSGSSSGG